MITKDNFKDVLENLNFKKDKNIYIKKFESFDLKVDFEKDKLIYPNEIKIHGEFTTTFKQNENFVVFECVHKLLTQGYNPTHIELEPHWQLGHGASGGRADILITDNEKKALLIIECKTYGKEFDTAWRNTLINPTQLFSYAQQIRNTKFICLYASDFIDEKLKEKYYLITLQDNEEYLNERKNDNLLSFKEATSTEEIYKVWKKTYSQEYSTKGIFEDSEAYNIGKTKFNIEDLSIVTSKDIQGKYHEFATILRQYNVSGREQAFDKLINLFLCKVVDEKNNPDELKFYWKGIAYDNPFELQDRLQRLYKDGMDKFLGEEITYIDKKTIDETFKYVKNNPDATKDKILEYFKQLKFFTNNDFAFTDVHNEKLFYKNFEVLLQIVLMLQDIKITTKEHNQFLGDMFEGFLDQGVKQSEGQFFTPMPIVKFIINSLPIDKILKIEDIPKVIDYACGAGHFLNEYASNIKSKVKNYREYYKETIGIEKEYRLSKVAKVSSFMYGQDDIQIVYDDSLTTNEKIKNSNFSLLVANPPYSVKGFLETLENIDRESYELIDSIDKKSYSANNAIECFFIERAKQLLKDGGVAGIIVPSSILTKGNKNIISNKSNIYVATREIILKYFNIIAIAEFGSGTFGKTGTNTVTLFLEKKSSNPPINKHLKNRVNSWFNAKFANDEIFLDGYLIKHYCNHLEINYSEYKKLLKNELSDILFELEIFKEYKSTYNKLNKQHKKKFTLVEYIRLIEKDKLYYFSLAYLNSKEVIIVKAPSNNNENKKFLGYEWSSAKGNEGIKYITSQNVNMKNDNLSENDSRVLENILNLESIQTPLYNPNNLYDESRINTLIVKNFSDEDVKIPENLEKFVSKAKLIDMLDFSRVEFNKGISLTPKKNIEIFGKLEWQIKISEICEIGRGRVINKQYIENNTGEYPIYSSQTSNNGVFGKINTFDFDGDYVTWTTDGIYAGTCTFRSGKFNCTNVCGTLKSKINNLEIKYLPYILNKVTANYVVKSANPKLMNNVMSNIKIPLPPLEIQKEIVKECEIVDKKVEESNEIIKELKNRIEKEISKIKDSEQKLSKLIEIIGGGTPKTNIPEYWGGDIPWLSVTDFNNENRFVSISTKTITKKGLKNSSTKVLQPNDLIISARGTVGALAQISIPMTFNQSCYGLRAKKEIDSGFLYYILKREINQLKENAYGTKFDSITTRTFENIKIPLPSLKTQKEIVSKIEKLEEEIKKSKEIIDNSKSKKEEVLKKYL